MALTKEDLLRDRYKVIADYPCSIHKVGDVLETHPSDPFDRIKYYDCEKYPNIFKRLEWWEDRKLEDMPKYVALVWRDKISYCHKVEKWIGPNSNGQPLYEYYNKVGYLSVACILELTPITEDEYNTFLSFNCK